jgi:phenylalanyl-tRNA synthetase alpha chain
MSTSINEEIEHIQIEYERALKKAVNSGDFDALYVLMFSKKNGLVTNLVKRLPTLTSDEKAQWGPKINFLQNDIKQKIETEKANFHKNELSNPLIDQSIPANKYVIGHLHPTTITIRRINEFFRYYGYSTFDGPHIEDYEYNFARLNLPLGHPATDLQDSVYIQEPNILLRTHTSSIETRLLSMHKPPIRAAFAGACYRNETVNATNSAFFHQYQGVVVDRGVNIQNLFSTLTDFHKFLFGDDVELRFRYKYYPEVSPGVGVDMKCKFCKGEGCQVCKHRGYIEVLGSGMIHYNTLKMCGIDPEIYTGFAFGIGLDRLVMQTYEINDIRKLYLEGLIYE